MDIITLQNIHVECILGCFPEERVQFRPVEISVKLYTDVSRAALTDDLRDAIDYDALASRLRGAAQASSYNLIESLAVCLAEICLQESGVEAVELTVTKPKPCDGIGAASVTVRRRKQ